MSSSVESRKWAENLVARIDADPRAFVKYKESRPITDIKDMLESSVKLFGSNTAFMQKNSNSEPYESISYDEMFAMVNELGTALISRGLKDKRIAVIGENSFRWAVSYLAVICGTGVVVPLDKELNADEIKNLIVKADVSAVLTSARYEGIFRKMKADGDTGLEMVAAFDAPGDDGDILSWQKLIEEGKSLIAEGDRSFLDARIDNEKMSVLLFTSGTTGASKGVMLSHKNLAADLMVSPTVLKVNDWDIFFSVLPLHHTYECTCGFLMPIYKGAAIAYCRGLKYITKDLAEVKPTMFLGVPLLFESLYRTIWKNIRKQGKEDLLRKVIMINNKTKKIGIDLGKIFFKQITDVFGGRMRLLICGGAAISPDVLNGIRNFGILALQGYGLTECAPMGALNPDTAPDPASIGVPFPGFEMKVVDANEEGIGELCLKGDNVMIGYYEMPDETAAVIDGEGWFHTGDMGYMNDKGYAFITGRKKNVIITKNGKNVYPEELEYSLSQVPFIEESFVFSGDQVDEQDTTIVASVRVDDEVVAELLGGEYSDDDVKKLIWSEVDKLNETAPFYRRIKKIILRKKEFEKNTSNKLIRFAEGNKLEGI